SLHGGLVQHHAAAPLPTQEHVGHDVEVVAERQVLVDDLDAESGSVAGTVDADRAAVEPDLPGVDRVDPADALDQRGLSRPVVADQRGHLAGGYREVNLAQHLYRPEALVDAAHL